MTRLDAQAYHGLAMTDERPPRAPSALVALVVLAGFGCANTATIARTDGPDNEAFIERSDSQALYVRGSNGQIYRLARRSVGEIDHPGNVLLTIGAVLGVSLGVALAGSSAAERRDVLRPLLLIYGLPSLAMMLTGGLGYLRSVQAVQAFQAADTPVMAVPPAEIPRQATPVPAPPRPVAPPAPLDGGADALPAPVGG
jgi:hypothetical protein